MAGIGRMANDGRGRMGGRQKGTPNKSTNDLKAWINAMLEDNKEQIMFDLLQVDPSQRLAFFEKLLPYVVPKKTQIEADIEAQFENALLLPPEISRQEAERIIRDHISMMKEQEGKTPEQIKQEFESELKRHGYIRAF